jgi:ligand-binding sensor protein
MISTRTLSNAAMLITLLLTGCGKEASVTAGRDGLATLVNVTPEAAGANCAHGGSKVESGLDRNANGALDSDEVSSTSYVCAPAGGVSGADGLVTLVSVTAESAGDNCAQGGSKVDAGLDTNGNGVLDPEEVTSTSYLCTPADGADGLATLVSVTAEAAGDNCAHGGSKVEAGIDTNANSVLDPAEVTSTTYVCKPADGADGSDGLVSLVAVTPEAAGDNCPTGGSKVEAGLDTNKNNVLDPGEVTTTSYVCSGPGVLWVEVDSDTQAQPNTGYLVAGAAQVAITLPTDPAVGDIVRVSGVGTGGWKLSLDPEQFIHYMGTATARWSPVDSAGSGRWRSVASSADGMHLVAAVYGGQIYTSADGGVTWAAREGNRNWGTVASSADGVHLVAAVYGGQIYTSADAGLSWAVREQYRFWISVASSADGMRLVAVVQEGQIYTSADGGVTWTAREQFSGWVNVASSTDGMHLVAALRFGRIYTSADAGVTWTAREQARTWQAVASSADGTRLVAVAYGGQISTSTDAGVTWTAREQERDWQSVASSADGMRLVAAVTNGQIYTSADAGVTWTAREQDRAWTSVASSADGMRLLAAAEYGQLYIFQRRTISGAQHEAIELQYVGNGVFTVLSSTGNLQVE